MRKEEDRRRSKWMRSKEREGAVGMVDKNYLRGRGTEGGLIGRWLLREGGD